MTTTTDSGLPPTLAEPGDGRPPPGRSAGVLGWTAVAAIGSSVLLMIVLAVSGPSAAVPLIPRTWPVPPLWFPLHLTDLAVVELIYPMVLLGAAGVVCGLLAVRRGARPRWRWLAAAAIAAVAVLTVLPPTGSTDSLSYATYGEMAATGHNPYVMTPEQFRATGNPVARESTRNWEKDPSLYGPVATGAEWLTAKLGGASISHILFWLKLLFALSFGAVALTLDRLLRRDPAARARAHLLWTVNPLMLWAVVSGAHIDALTAALGLLGLIVIRPGPLTRWAGLHTAGATAGQRSPGRPGRPGLGRCLVAGLLIGAVAGVKAPFALLGFGPAWAARRSPAALATMAAGAALVLGPAYLLAGHAALTDLTSQSTLVVFDSYWRLVFPPFGYSAHAAPHLLMPAVLLLGVGLAGLMLWRLPPGLEEFPAIRPALVVMLAWLLVWPMQRPWYDAIAFCLLAMFPASRLDWLVLIRTVPALIIMSTTGVGPVTGTNPQWLNRLFLDMSFTITPQIMLGVLVAIFLLCVTGQWQPWRPPPLVGVTAARHSA